MTMTGPDLTQAKAAVEALMDDTCRITRDLAVDDSLPDPITLRTNKGAGPIPFYNGRCKIKDLTNGKSSTRFEGGKEYAVALYELGIPLDEAPVLHRGDVVTWLTSRRDAGLVGRQFRVTEPIYKTFAIQRKALLELYTEQSANI